MLDGAGAGNGTVCGDGCARRGNYRPRLGCRDRRRRGGVGRTCVRKAAAGSSALGAGGAGRFGDSGREGFGRQSNLDRSGKDYGKISGKIWSKGASGVFVGRDRSEGAKTG